MKTLYPVVFLLVFSFSQLPGIILYGHGNDDPLITSAPENGAPWASVAKVTNANGTDIHGSAVYLGNGFMLTAHHVSTNERAVSFDGIQSFAVDTDFPPVQIGTADLKVFRLSSIPDVPAVNLFNGINTTTTGTHIGWGVGRGDVAVDTNAVSWGGTDTVAKRWGTNNWAFAQNVSYDFGATTYTQASLITIVGNNAGATEAALTLYDSGSGFFQNFSGTWYLTGIAYTVSAVSGANTSTFGLQNSDQLTVSNGDFNFVVNISAYQSEILAAIPEPSTAVLLSGILALVFAYSRKRVAARHSALLRR